MNFDVAPMLSALLPTAFPASLQTPAPAEEFSALLELGELPGKPRIAADGANFASVSEPAKAPKSTKFADGVAPEGDPAIAQADALASVFIPEAEPAKESTETSAIPHAPAVLPPIDQRLSPLPPEMVDNEAKDQPELDNCQKEADGQAPIIVQTPSVLEPATPAPAPTAPVARADTIKDARPIPARIDASTEATPPVAAQGEESPQRPAAAERLVEATLSSFRKQTAKAMSEPATMAKPNAGSPKSTPVNAAEAAKFINSMVDIPPASAPAVKLTSDVPAAVSAPPQVTAAAPSPADMMIDRQLDLVRNERWLGELAQDIANTSDSNDRLSFRLMPHQLGRLDVAVSRSHDGLSLTIRTESDSAQSILTAAQPRLADELRAQGVRVADTQMLSGDAPHSHHKGGTSRPAPLVETFLTPSGTLDAPEQVQRDGLYA